MFDRIIFPYKFTSMLYEKIDSKHDRQIERQIQNTIDRQKDKFKMTDQIWDPKCENQIEPLQTFGVDDDEFDIKFLKFKIADTI